MINDYFSDMDVDICSLIIDHLDGVVITDPEGRYVYVNEAWSKMMGGLKLEDIKGKLVRDLIPDTKIHHVLKTKKPIRGHVIIAKGPGKIRAFSSYIPIMKDGKLVAGFIHVIIRGMEAALDFSLKINSMSKQIKYYEEELRKIRGAKYSIHDIAGTSEKILEMKDRIIRAARTNSTVLIEGETGTGKELVAHSVHDLSMRSSYPFIKVNCAAIPKNLLESEFFGYEEGSFTGAKKGGSEGRFQMANEGSLFFDEINELPLELQPKLLRALQEQEIEKIGGKESIPVDVRVIVATNVSLEEQVKKKKFREDLFYRINVIKIRIPPLRERKEDIPILADDILKKMNFQLGMSISGIDSLAKERLKDYNWPGNVRELQNVIERAMNNSYGETLQWKHFSSYFENKNIRKNSTFKEFDKCSITEMKEKVERDAIIEGLEKCGGNKTKLAKQLGISRTALYNKINRYNINK